MSTFGWRVRIACLFEKESNYHSDMSTAAYTRARGNAGPYGIIHFLCKNIQVVAGKEQIQQDKYTKQMSDNICE